MSGLLRSLMPTPITRHVLGLLDELVEDIAVVDLDTIDGEFYWRVCRRDLLEQVTALCTERRTGRHDTDRPNIMDIDKPEKPDAVLGFLRQSLRQANDLYAIEAKAAALYPRAVWRRLVQGERVAMRAADADVQHIPGGDGRMLLVKIYSGAWTGKEVEAEVRRQDPDGLSWLDGERKKGSVNDPVHLAVDFSFSQELERSPTATDGHQRSPYVTVGIPLPGPPPGVISREYEALVCSQRQWHRHLPGAGTRQEKEVALRTWAVGLLMTHGIRFADAMREVSMREGLGDVSQARFGQDRTRLLERIPEASASLRAKQTSSAVGRPTDTPVTTASIGAPDGHAPGGAAAPDA